MPLPEALRGTPIQSAWRWLRDRLPIRPRSYWTSRHERFAGSLSGPGHADMTEADNAADYAERRTRLREIVGAFAPKDGETKALLDAGCGTGLLFPEWRSLGFAVTGMDFASAEARSGRGPGGEIVLLGDICELPAEPKYDVIACVDVLFHVLSDRKWKRFLETSSGALRPGGRLVIEEQLVADADYRGAQRHCHFRRAADYESAAAAAGLSLATHSRYALPRSGVVEDVLVYVRDSGRDTERDSDRDTDRATSR
jgi:SAM-dependent methyltransferase